MNSANLCYGAKMFYCKLTSCKADKVKLFLDLLNWPNLGWKVCFGHIELQPSWILWMFYKPLIINSSLSREASQCKLQLGRSVWNKTVGPDPQPTFKQFHFHTHLSVLCWTRPEYVTDFAGAEAVLSGKRNTQNAWTQTHKTQWILQPNRILVMR